MQDHGAGEVAACLDGGDAREDFLGRGGDEVPLEGRGTRAGEPFAVGGVHVDRAVQELGPD